MEKKYDEPAVEVIEIEVERGFAASDGFDVGIDGWESSGPDQGGSAC